MNSIEISKKIYSILSGDDRLKELVDDKIYPLIAESDTKYPFVVFKRSQINPEYTKDWLTTEQVILDIVCASSKYFEVVDVASAVRTALEGYKDDDLLEGIKVQYITEDFFDDCYTQRITFQIMM